MRVLLVGAVLLASCGNPSTSPADDLVVTAEVTSTTVRAPDTVAVRVVVTNRSTRSWEINVHSCEPNFVVTDLSGTLIGPARGQICTTDLPMKDLAPGDEHVFSRSWTSDVPPGTYLLRGQVLAHGGLVTGQPVTITVTPYVAP